MLRIRDDVGRELLIPRPPRRVVSLVPSDTLTLFDLGAGARVVGRSRYCVEPGAELEAVPTCGGTKDTDVEAVLALEPELVIANKEENARGPIEALMKRGAPVFVSFPRTASAGVAHMARLARILGIEREDRARECIRRGYQAVERALAARTEVARAVFLPIWMDPLMTLGLDTFASDMLALAGARNVFSDRVRRYPLAADLGLRNSLPPEQVGERDTRYPRVTLAEVAERGPEAVLLPDEPHPFSADDAAVFHAALPSADVRFCDGRDLFWYGSRTAEALPRLTALIQELSQQRA
ncbi:MAG TPA: helical backbone metal receptor [Kofleriaceae bacterium]|nr:helical backbone metal receptor [Kofleriaceae bacterium]